MTTANGKNELQSNTVESIRIQHQSNTILTKWNKVNLISCDERISVWLYIGATGVCHTEFVQQATCRKNLVRHALVAPREFGAIGCLSHQLHVKKNYSLVRQARAPSPMPSMSQTLQSSLTITNTIRKPQHKRRI